MKKRFFSLFVCTALLLSILCSAHAAWAASSSGDGDTYDFWFFRLPGQSTKDFELMLSSLQVPETGETDSAVGESGLVGGDTYTDPVMGASFVVPENWAEEKLLEETDGLAQICLVSLKDFKSSIQYSSYDIWRNEMTASERSGHTRSDIDSAYAYTNGWPQKLLVDTFVQQGFDVSVDDVQLVTYGKTEYIELTASQEISGKFAMLTISWHIKNGYLYDFTFGGANDEAAKDFQSVLHSFQVRESEAPSGQNASGPTLSELLANDGLHPLTFLLNLLLTFSVYTLPILIYRFVLHTGPLEKKRARKIVIIYGICAYLLMCLIMALLNGHAGIAIVFWSYVNYGILISGKKPEPDPTDVPAAPPDRLPPEAPMSAPAAPETTPFIPAAAAPVTPAPQTPPPAAAYVSDSPALQTPVSPVPQAQPAAPAAQRGTSVSDAPATSMWPAQYHSAQDRRAGSPKRSEKAPASTPVPAAPQTPSSPAAYPSASAATQASPAASSEVSAPATPAASMWPTQYHSAQDMRAGFPKQSEKAPATRPVPPATQMPPAAPFVPAAPSPSIPAAPAPTASAPQTPPSTAEYPSAPPASQTSPAAPMSAPAAPETAPFVPAAAAPAAPASQTPLAAEYPPASAAPQASPSPTPYTSTLPAPQTPPSAPRIQFCRNCGFRLLEDSRFCSACGTPVVPGAKE